MIKSMTGFGKDSLSKEQRDYQIEIKSVNHRYLDISVRLPRTLSYLEEEIKKEIGKYLKRGKIDIFLSFDNKSDIGKEIKINKEIAKMYIKELRELAKEEKLKDNIEVTEISKLPDVLSIQNNQDEETIKQEVIETTNSAILKLMEMRKAEGEKIAEDLIVRMDKVQNKIEEISEISTGLIDEYVVKLEKRIQDILKNQELDQTRLAQEVVIYADKCSIEEEITRLKSHISQFRQMIQSEEPIGKKMDFLLQEMNRETNTIGSKANNLEITNGVIDMKTELEDIREQVQNIE